MSDRQPERCLYVLTHQPQTQAPDYISTNPRSRWCASLLWPDQSMPHFRLYPVPVSPAPKAAGIVVNATIIHHQRKRRLAIDAKIQRTHKSIFQTNDGFSRCFGDGDWFRRAGAMPHTAIASTFCGTGRSRESFWHGCARNFSRCGIRQMPVVNANHAFSASSCAIRARTFPGMLGCRRPDRLRQPQMCGC